jgi:hypothetical protein
LLEQGAKETVVLQGSHGGIRKKSAGIFSDTNAKGTVSTVPFIYRVDLLPIAGSLVGARLPANAVCLWQTSCLTLRHRGQACSYQGYCPQTSR